MTNRLTERDETAFSSRRNCIGTITTLREGHELIDEVARGQPAAYSASEHPFGSSQTLD